MPALHPGSTIGILGGGQLGRMLSLAAARLGLKCHVYAPEIDSPAFAVAAAHTCAAYEDEAALDAFARQVDAVTFEFENVPVSAITFLEKLVPVRPGAKALGVAQDRLKEKWMARDLGAMTADFAAITSESELREQFRRLAPPYILKTTRMGYDGKGQARIASEADIEAAWKAMKDAPAILERFVEFDCEISVICARSESGHFVAYDIPQNQHSNGILATSTVPATVDEELQIEAVFVAQRIADALDYVGVLAVEFFVGAGVLYVNEIAPRVHNSGHWTMDACLISQFEQHMRAVAGWPLGSTARHSDVVMSNLLGDDASHWEALAATPQVGLHLYGKGEARPGRKMGHFNRITPRQG